MLDAVEQTSQQTTVLVTHIRDLMQHHKEILRERLPKIYSQDLINNLFCHPYTKIEFVATELNVSRQTASRYLEEVVTLGLLSKHKIGKDNFYLNDDLFDLLLAVGQTPPNSID
jgi:Fic family protein